MQYIYTIKYQSVTENEILWFAATWMKLENTMLNDIRVLKDKHRCSQLICGSQNVDLKEENKIVIIQSLGRVWGRWRKDHQQVQGAAGQAE